MTKQAHLSHPTEAQDIEDLTYQLLREGETLAIGAPPLTAEQVDRVVSVLRLS